MLNLKCYFEENSFIVNFCLVLWSYNLVLLNTSRLYICVYVSKRFFFSKS